MKPHEFLEQLWGPAPNGLIQIVQIGPRGARPSYLQAARGASALDGTVDLYTCVALSSRRYPTGQRPTARQARGIAGLWLDLDVAGGPDELKGNKVPIPTIDDAIDIAYRYIAPTILVKSGYGLHAWYLLPEPWLFTGFDEQDEAALMAAQWFQLHRTAAAAKGWTVDHAHDLARLMRVPGTINGKGGHQVPVDVLPGPDGQRYTRQHLANYAAGAGPVTVALHSTPRTAGLAAVNAATLDSEKLEILLELSPEVHAAFHHNGGLGSLSEYDLSLCSIVAHHGGPAWTDNDLAGLIAAHRLHHDPADRKHQRIDYLNRTVGLARQRARRLDVATDLEHLNDLKRAA